MANWKKDCNPKGVPVYQQELPEESSFATDVASIIFWVVVLASVFL